MVFPPVFSVEDFVPVTHIHFFPLDIALFNMGSGIQGITIGNK